MEIELEDDTHFFSLEERGIPLKNWKLVYEHPIGNDRLYQLTQENSDNSTLVMVSFSSSDGNGDCWQSESLYVDVIFKAIIDYGGLHHLHFNEYICYPETDALMEAIKYVHNVSDTVKKKNGTE